MQSRLGDIHLDLLGRLRREAAVPLGDYGRHVSSEKNTWPIWSTGAYRRHTYRYDLSQIQTLTATSPSVSPNAARTIVSPVHSGWPGWEVDVVELAMVREADAVGGAGAAHHKRKLARLVCMHCRHLVYIYCACMWRVETSLRACGATVGHR